MRLPMSCSWSYHNAYNIETKTNPIVKYCLSKIKLEASQCDGAVNIAIKVQYRFLVDLDTATSWV